MSCKVCLLHLSKWLLILCHISIFTAISFICHYLHAQADRHQCFLPINHSNTRQRACHASHQKNLANFAFLASSHNRCLRHNLMHSKWHNTSRSQTYTFTHSAIIYNLFKFEHWKRILHTSWCSIHLSTMHNTCT